MSVHWRMFNSILGLYPPDARSICSVMAVRDVLTLPLVPWEVSVSSS